MNKYYIINGVNGKFHVVRGEDRYNFELFCGYDTDGNAVWIPRNNSWSKVKVFDSIGKAKKIIKDLESADMRKEVK